MPGGRAHFGACAGPSRPSAGATGPRPPPAPRAPGTHHGRGARGPTPQRRQQAPRSPRGPESRRHGRRPRAARRTACPPPTGRARVRGQLLAASPAAPHSPGPPRRPGPGPAPEGPQQLRWRSAGSARTQRGRPPASQVPLAPSAPSLAWRRVSSRRGGGERLTRRRFPFALRFALRFCSSVTASGRRTLMEGPTVLRSVLGVGQESGLTGGCPRLRQEEMSCGWVLAGSSEP